MNALWKEICGFKCRRNQGKEKSRHCNAAVVIHIKFISFTSWRYHNPTSQKPSQMTSMKLAR